MSKRVILIRHAKSSWGEPSLDDHERPLNARGRASAPAIGKWLKTRGETPDIMLVSTAKRTIETANLIRDAWPSAPDMTTADSLYLAAPQTMLDVLQKTDAPCIALVAHNPGIALLARGLLNEAPDHPRFIDYPTGATTVIDFDYDIEPGLGRCAAFVVPRDLLG